MHADLVGQPIDEVAMYVDVNSAVARELKSFRDRHKADAQLVLRKLVQRQRPVAFRYLGRVVVVFRHVPEVHRLDAKRRGETDEGFEMQAVLVIKTAQEVKMWRPAGRGGADQIDVGD